MWQSYQGVCFRYTSCFSPLRRVAATNLGVFTDCVLPLPRGELRTFAFGKTKLFYKWRTWKSLLLHCVEWCSEGDVVRRQLLSEWSQHFKSTCRYISQMSSFQGKWTNWVRKTLFVLSFSTELGCKRWTESLMFNKFTKITLKCVFKNSDP